MLNKFTNELTPWVKFIDKDCKTEINPIKKTSEESRSTLKKVGSNMTINTIIKLHVKSINTICIKSESNKCP